MTAMHEMLNELRPRMMSIACRILGSVPDAEDAVQDAFLCLLASRGVASPAGFLVKATTHRCLDSLRGKRRREKHFESRRRELADTRGSGRAEALAEPLGEAFQFMLERLTPIEMAAYLLRTVFDYGYSDIAEILDKTQNHVRQILCRANSRLLRRGHRFQPTAEEADRLADRFVDACRSGNIQSIEQLFVEGTEACFDGKNKRSVSRDDLGARHRSTRFVAETFDGSRRHSATLPAPVRGVRGDVSASDGAVLEFCSARRRISQGKRHRTQTGRAFSIGGQPGVCGGGTRQPLPLSELRQ